LLIVGAGEAGEADAFVAGFGLFVGAAAIGIAGIGGAVESVVATEFSAGDAGAVGAGLAEGAGVAVIAGYTLLCSSGGALAGGGFARGDCTFGEAVVGAGDDGIWIDLAEASQETVNALQRAVTEVVVLIGCAIAIGVAKTLVVDSYALAFEAVIHGGAGVPVVARVLRKGSQATEVRVAEVEGAGVVIVAGERAAAFTTAGEAEIAQGTLVTVIASGAVFERSEFASVVLLVAAGHFTASGELGEVGAVVVCEALGGRDSDL
jgi:hypothetical protein